MLLSPINGSLHSSVSKSSEEMSSGEDFKKERKRGIQLKVASLKADILFSCGLQSNSLPQEVRDIAGDKIEGKKVSLIMPFSKL